MMERLAFALDVTLPILLVLALGPLMRKIEMVDDHFVTVANRIVFNLSLPCMLFFGVANQPLQYALDIPMVLFATVATIISTILLWIFAPLFVVPSKRGVFVQG